jgi:class 3 adenylate cyclase
MTAEDLKDLGVGSVGHRRKLLDAIAAFRAEANKASPSEARAITKAPAKDVAERRHSVPSAAAAAPPPTSASAGGVGERHYLTIMFCDLVDSTGIAAKLDAEEWRDLVTGRPDGDVLRCTRMKVHETRRPR